jgi:Flp pilus assembly protein TadG
MKWPLNRKGQSIVELALITPIILVALYVPFDFGVSIYAGHLTQNVARDGARRVATTDVLDNTKATNLATQIAANLPPLLTSGSTTKQVTVNYYATGGATCAQSVEVIAQGAYTFFWYRLIGFVGLAPSSSIPIIRTTKMRYEFQPDTNSAACSTTATATGHS